MGAKGVLNWTCVNKEEDLEYLVKNGFPVSAHSSEEDLNYVKYNGFTVSAHLIYDLIIGARLQDGNEILSVMPAPIFTPCIE